MIETSVGGGALLTLVGDLLPFSDTCALAVDALKSSLLESGVEVQMSKEGVKLKQGAAFDATKLEGLL